MATLIKNAKFQIGQIVRHKIHDFRGLIYDIDPEFNNTEEWYLSIPEKLRPAKKQPFYYLFAENAENRYEAYVSEQNLIEDSSGEPLHHPKIDTLFVREPSGVYRVKKGSN